MQSAVYLGPRVRFDLGEFKLRVVGVHLPYLFSSGCAEHFDDLD